MAENRTFDEHVQLFVAYATRVSQLSPAAWDRLRLRCADLDEPAFAALVRRARLAARPHERTLPPELRRMGVVRLIAATSKVVQRSFAFAGEVAAEFEASSSKPPEPPRKRTRSTGKPAADAYIDASFLIDSALTPIERTNPGVATAVRTAGRAVLLHDWLDQADFDASYALVEPDIPFAELAPPDRQ